MLVPSHHVVIAPWPAPDWFTYTVALLPYQLLICDHLKDTLRRVVFFDNFFTSQLAPWLAPDWFTQPCSQFSSADPCLLSICTASVSSCGELATRLWFTPIVPLHNIISALCLWLPKDILGRVVFFDNFSQASLVPRLFLRLFIRLNCLCTCVQDCPFW